MATFSLLKSLLPFRGRKRATAGDSSPDAGLAALTQARREEASRGGEAQRPVPHRRASTAITQPKKGNHPHRLPAAELGIEQRRIHPHVQHVVQTLQRQGFQALVVGGAVRDLLLGRMPKDFDIVTSARPEQVRRIFRNARVIGRRFRLCLLRFGEMQVEVSTFRGLPRPVAAPSGRGTRGRESGSREPGGMIRRDNTFGTPREDAFRRDFTINALALDPQRMELMDYVGGLEDLRARRIRTISPAVGSFAEDPVRMLRAVRFQVRLGFALDPALEAALGTQAHLLAEVKRHRLADETQRFLVSGFANRMFDQFHRRRLIEPLLGLEMADCFDPQAVADPLSVLRPYLQGLERWVAEGREALPPTVALLGLIVTLARPELRDYLMSRPAASARQRQSLRRLKRGLPAQLVEWGLLRGQMEPALRILATARLLLRRREEPQTSRAAHRLGEREARLLLGALQPVLGLQEDFVQAGLSRVPHLPDLPILDHPRPARRGPDPEARTRTTAPIESRAARGTGASERPGPGRRRRRRRNRPRGAGNNEG